MGKKRKGETWSDRHKWLKNGLWTVATLAMSKMWDAFSLPVAAPTASRVGSLPTATKSVVASQSSRAATASISNHVATESLSLGENLRKQLIRTPTP